MLDVEEINRKSILIADDSATDAYDIKKKLEFAGYRIAGLAGSGEEALDIVGNTAPDLVIMNIHLGVERDGIAAAQRIMTEYSIPLVYLTDNQDCDDLGLAIDTAP
ncbi:MAG: response regulator, partial [Spirochaetota bacterium]